MDKLFSIVPWYYKLLAVGLLAAFLIGYGWVKGAGHVQGQWDAAVEKQEAQQARVRVRQAEVTVRVVTQYVDRVRVIREKGDVIIKEVPAYVTPESDSRCTINAGFVRLHDAAATNEVPGPARTADAAPAGIALSAVAGTVAENYRRCHENAAQLTFLQEWVREQAKAANDGGLAQADSPVTVKPLRRTRTQKVSSPREDGASRIQSQSPSVPLSP